MQKRLTPYPLIALLCILILAACASIGSPDGGAYDETPPKVVKCQPANMSVNNRDKKLTLTFDEFIVLENASEKVVVSPPQKEMPEIRTSGKRIHITLNDSLKENTTYTVDFSDAIVDNNEGNPMGNFTYAFSTGTEIDTMEVSGTLLEAENLEPIKGMLVGLYVDLSDSASLACPVPTAAGNSPSKASHRENIVSTACRIWTEISVSAKRPKRLLSIPSSSNRHVLPIRVKTRSG